MLSPFLVGDGQDSPQARPLVPACGFPEETRGNLFICDEKVQNEYTHRYKNRTRASALLDYFEGDIKGEFRLAPVTVRRKSKQKGDGVSHSIASFRIKRKADYS
jgi:hypothetical protein